jgi:hypothetical protein
VHCVSHIEDLTNLAGYPPLKPNIIFYDYLLDHNLSLRMDHQFKEECKTVPRLKISSISPKEKYSRYLPHFITSLPEDEQTYKHGGGGRYNAILKFKGEQIKIFKRKMMKREKIYMRKKRKKRKKYEYV